MALTNKLHCSFNHQSIDEQYDIFQITTSDKYIARGARVLDTPIESIKAVSLVFDYGRSAFVAFYKKDYITQSALMKSLAEEKLSVKKIFSSEVKDYVLIRLFIYSLANYLSESNMFNNIGGKLYITHPSWKSRNGKNIKALEISVERDMCMTASATTFTSISVFKDKKSKALLELPRYLLSANGKFRRALNFDETKDAYVNKGIPGKKAELPFLELKQDTIRMGRAYFMNKIVEMLNDRFSAFLSVSFSNIDIERKVTERRDIDFVEKSLDCVSNHGVYLTSRMVDGAYSDDMQSLKSSLSKALGKQINDAAVDKSNDMEIVFLHNEDYYQDKDDPYKKLSRDHVAQCITLEDATGKIVANKKAVINTIFKEMTIKNDILRMYRITLDDWSSFKFEHDWIFGEEKSGKKYFMVIHPDGTFEFERQEGFLGRYRNKVLYELSNKLDELDLKGKVIILDDKGNINVISRTNLFCMPNPEIFKLEKLSRNEESREKYLSGIVDINLFNDNGECFYSAGIVGYGMNTAIPKAGLLYKVTVVEGKNVIESILETMSVMFVKYNSFTVLPYPIKYLIEYMKITDAN